MDNVRVLLVDDHTVVRRGLREILDADPDIEVIGEAGDGIAAVAMAGKQHPDVVLMDLSMPGMNGIEATRRITGSVPGAKVLILSVHGDGQYVQQSMAAGAVGYLLKDVDVDELLTAIKAIGRDEPWSSNGSPGLDPLTPKEREVLRLIASSRSSREIAAELQISIHTVETHRKHIMEKLDLHSTADLVRYAIRQRLVS